MLTMERFQQENISTYDEAARNLKKLGIAPSFDIPNFHVVVSDDATQADCALLVIPADSTTEELMGEFAEAASRAKQFVVLINRMDDFGWSEDAFQKLVQGLGASTENTPIIPFSALHGDNVVEPSSESSWYKGWSKGGKSGTTLLDALEASF